MKTNLQQLPKDMIDLLNLFQKHHAQVFFVGGCVRDMLMNRDINDYDMTTNLLPEMVQNIFQKAGYKTIPTGMKHGTITVLTNQHAVEITTFRKETTYDDHRRPTHITFSNSIEEDLLRRDFTMNAIAYHPSTGFIDPFHGMKDIENRCIRCVGNPIERFQEDALRILRALRFCATLSFQIEEATWSALQTCAKDLSYISKERMREELNRLLMGEKENTLAFLRKANVLTHLFPNYDIIYDHNQKTPWHLYDIFTHTDIALNHTKGYPLESKLAIILHDIGKVECEHFDEKGIAHYKMHALVSEEKARNLLKRLTYDKQSIEHICLLIRYHDYYVQPKRSILRRYLSKFQHDTTFALQALDVQIADDMAKNLERSQEKITIINQSKKLIFEMVKEDDVMKRSDLCVNGNDVMKLGFQGKEIGEVLLFLYDIVLETPTYNTKEFLLEKVKTYKKTSS